MHRGITRCASARYTTHHLVCVGGCAVHAHTHRTGAYCHCAPGSDAGAPPSCVTGCHPNRMYLACTTLVRECVQYRSCCVFQGLMLWCVQVAPMWIDQRAAGYQSYSRHCVCYEPMAFRPCIKDCAIQTPAVSMGSLPDTLHMLGCMHLDTGHHSALLCSDVIPGASGTPLRVPNFVTFGSRSDAGGCVQWSHRVCLYM